ncbi:hypothetical protein DY000_02020516 [Brassica cretica]|uniref:Uncharacterized protein n=1 Tax=Brassica cretica TaxID=69181 RepID=A0ABQ7EIJ8_BRACR|nr:hypothetical protein DY000_02020516 [Brassica cretica]
MAFIFRIVEPGPPREPRTDTRWDELEQSRAEVVKDQEHLRAGADRVFVSRNTSKNNLGFLGIRVPKDQDGAVYCFCECGRV